MKKLYQCMVAVILGVFLFGMTVYAQTDHFNVKVTGTYCYEEVKEVVDLVNAERAKVGREPLKLDAKLQEAAMQRAAEIAVYFDHRRPNGKGPTTILPQDEIIGENIANGCNTASWVMDEWMYSEGHKNNILHTWNTSIGVGCYKDGYGRFTWVQLFGGEYWGSTYTPGDYKKNQRVTPTIEIDPKTVKEIGYSLDSLENQYKIDIGKTLVLKPVMGKSTLDLSCGTFTNSNSNVVDIDQKTGTILAKSEGIADIRFIIDGTDRVEGVWRIIVKNPQVNKPEEIPEVSPEEIPGVIPQPTGSWQVNSTGWWYQNADGSYPAGCWQMIDGQWYLFDGSGYMLTGWQMAGNSWYYLSGSGAMVTGWLNDGGNWYYLNESGAMATGWYTVNGTWYYAAGNGVMQTGWQMIGNAWYYLNGNGAMVTGWLHDGGVWYYLQENGAMATGWYSVNGTWYYSVGNGIMAENQWVGNYYVGQGGSMWTNVWTPDGFYVGADGTWIPGM